MAKKATVIHGSVSRRLLRFIGHGTELALTATPADGWTGTVEGPDNHLTLTIQSDTTLTAVFKPLAPTGCFAHHTATGESRTAATVTGDLLLLLLVGIVLTGWRGSFTSGETNTRG